MRIDDFVAIEDFEIEGQSLIEQVFGFEFCVVDEDLHKLTTAHNRTLLQRARDMIEQQDGIDAAMLVEALEELSTRAETVRQSDYEDAIGRQPEQRRACFDPSYDT